MKLIYLDHAATTPVHPEVVEAMLPYFSEIYGNASSTHSAGREARTALNAARDRIASFIGCSPSEIVFAGSGTESDNMALLGAAEAYRSRGRHIITTSIEHHAVLHACERLEALGYEVTYLPVDCFGQVSLSDVEKAVRPDTTLISVMYGNNETGTLQPIEAIGRFARERGICFHVDAVQALAHIPIDLGQLPVDLMSFSAHKLNGPKGIGALYISRTTRIAPLLFGGSQERKRRPGTENTAGIAGFAKAIEILQLNRYELKQKMEKLRQGMVNELTERLDADAFVINGHPTEQLPHILNVSFSGISTETMLMNLDLAGVAAASGSACTSGSLEVSHVLKAMKLPEDVTGSAIRFSFGANNDEQQISEAVSIIETIVRRLRTNR
ncbi:MULTISPECIES: cysteine desulfurase family protein [unclassified Paenibacillus]|uniref:cysteine desulfurase family protein n=1 Tax=unclassified Paenibacillus TaxID=185978 RepID=UPI001AE12F0A|nr:MULTISPECIES: cysteine desulfurase family protein [unclassified Paenibacillus]MBP1156527.1 cysteine desulfurase [Paenibacillus sp. PvP091]MBP1172735.1 cysteine desulfurase [Paenibacillus sp. PvR098]MBP2439115.1 cysteine desulfurase [Paenibacillus sp. PvP052]